MDSGTSKVKIKCIFFGSVKSTLSLFLKEYLIIMFIFYSNTPISYDRPVCTCGIHLAWSRSRLRMLNDTARNTKLMTALTKVYNTIVNIKYYYDVIMMSSSDITI